MKPGATWFGEVDTISCPDPTYCVALASNQYQDDSLILSAGTWNTAPLVEPGGALQLNSVSVLLTPFVRLSASALLDQAQVPTRWA